MRLSLQAVLVVLGCFLAPDGGALAAGSMSGTDAARSLGSLLDGARANAIAALARGGQIGAPLSGADGAAILLGTTHSSRASAIAELAAFFKADLSGQEASAILGPEDALTDGNRSNAIAALARAKRFGPSIGEDAALALKGATHSSRAAAIAEIAPYLRIGTSGQAIAAIVGPASAIADGNRSNAIAAIARTTKQIAVLSGADGAAILLGAGHSSRAAAIAELASLFKADLSGQEAAAILGPEDVLTDGNRSNAIAALARAKRFGPSIGEDAALALKGATHSSRAAAIAEIAPYLRTGMTGSAIAAVVGTAAEITDGNRSNAIAAIARTTKQISVLSGADGGAILLGATHSSRASAISELAALFKTDLSGQEAAAILGPEDVLTDGNRSNAIAALARAKRFGPSIGEDAALALKGAAQSSRASAIAEMATYLRNGMSGQAIAAILGDPSVLGEGNRYNAINALATAGKLPGVLSGDEIVLIVLGMTGQARAGAITLLSNAAKQQSVVTRLPMGGAPAPSTTAGTTPMTTGVNPSAGGDASPLPPQSIDEMRKLADSYVYAQLSEAAYTLPYLVKTQSRVADQIWTRVADRSGGASGFKAAAYLSRDGRTCVVAFAGTDSGLSWETVRDLGTDFSQWFLSNPSKPPAQYADAEAFVRRAVDGPCKGRNVTLTGHSLGGGLAQYAYLRTGRAYPTNTFNAAGLAPLSVAYQVANIGENKAISNFYSMSYDADGKLLGRDVVSLTGVTLGPETAVPVNGWRIATHYMAVLREAIGVYRDRCRLDPACR